MPIWLTSLLAFFGKGWERFLSIFAYLLIFAFLFLGAWRIINPKPTATTTVQSGGVKNEYNIKVGALGCARIPVIKQ